MTRFVIIAIAAISLTAPLSACGKKGDLARPSLSAPSAFEAR